MWIVRASQPGLTLSEAENQTLHTVYRSRFEWLAKIVYWLWNQRKDVCTVMLDQDDTVETTEWKVGSISINAAKSIHAFPPLDER